MIFLQNCLLFSIQVQRSTENWTSELHSAVDTILLESGDTSSKEELLGDLRRATQGCAICGSH